MDLVGGRSPFCIHLNQSYIQISESALESTWPTTLSGLLLLVCWLQLPWVSQRTRKEMRSVLTEHLPTFFSGEIHFFHSDSRPLIISSQPPETIQMHNHFSRFICWEVDSFSELISSDSFLRISGGGFSLTFCFSKNIFWTQCWHNSYFSQLSV